VRGLIQHFLFSGTGWFFCGAAILTAVALDLAGARRSLKAGRVAVLLALAVAVLSGTPLPWWLAIPAAAVVLSYSIFFYGRRNVAIAAAVVVATITAMVHEARFFFARPKAAAAERVFIMGDSISSGGFAEKSPWPEILARHTGIAVKNLSQPSETVSSALVFQAPNLDEFRPGDVVIVELGGNDMLGGTNSSQFTRDLDRLLAIARDGGRREVLMFEVPLLPGKWSLGNTQRRTAREHGVELIPRRVLTRLLTDRDNVTDDALHLSPRGHQRMAEEVEKWIVPTPARKDRRSTVGRSRGHDD
jgi:acyl-CoA thioesterase I